jgi:hypothetical protein
VVAIAVLAAVSLGAAACSSSSNSSSTTASNSTAATVNAATENQDITNSFNTLFDLANPNVDPKIAVVQDGSSIRTAFQAALQSSAASSAAGSKIDSISSMTASACHAASLPSPCAKVVYDILGPSGTAILPNSQGYAVYVNGQWLVAKTSICQLLVLFYQTEGKTGSPPGC